MVAAVEPGLTPPPPSSVNDGAGSALNDQESPSHALRFTRNEARQYSPIPVVLGQHRAVPPLAAETVTRLINGVQYQEIIVLWGYGPLAVSDIRINNAPLTDYDDISIETRPGRSSDAALTLYTGTLPTPPEPMAVSAIRIRITDQLPRVVNEISGLVKSECLDWSSGAWAAAATSNPASILRYVLQHPGRRHPATDAGIDLSALQGFHAFCVTNGYEFNAIHDTRRSVWDLAEDICNVARAKPSLSGGKWAVVVDDGAQSVVDHLTAVNVGGFRVKKSFRDIPHAMRVRFNNRNKDWQRDERVVYRDGYDATTATNIPTSSPSGITSPEHVWKYGRRQLALLEVREQWECNSSLESIMLRRGSKVTVQHDALGVGLGSTRVEAVTVDAQGDVTALKLQAPITFPDTSLNYSVKIRTVNDPDLIAALDVANTKLTKDLTLSTPLNEDVAVGDLVSIGETGSVQTEGLVRSIDRRNELTASLVVIPYRSSVYDAETGSVPTFVSALSDLPDPLPPVVVVSTASGRDVFQLLGNVYEPRILITVNAIPVAGARLEVQLRESGQTAWTPGDIRETSLSTAVLASVLVGTTYNIRLRWILPEDNRVGEWGAVSHQVQAVVPADPTGFSVTDYADGTRVVQFFPPNIDDLAGVKVRYGSGGQAWAAMSALHDGTLTASPLETIEPSPGTYDFLARTVTTGGHQSTGVRLASQVLGGQRRFIPSTTIGGNRPGSPEDGDYYIDDDGNVERWNGSAWVDTNISLEGSEWLTGSGAPAASLGSDGDFYFRTSNAVVYSKASGAWTEQFSIAGDDGSVWHSGSGLPGGTVGAVGDFFFRTDQGYIYQKTGATAWTFLRDITGPQGVDGKTWYTGSGAPSNSTGADGDLHFRTSNSTVWEKAGGTWSQIADLSGADGSTWTSGSGAPSNSSGDNGDWYFRTSNASIYRKSSGSWSLQVDVSGTDGSDGSSWYSGSGAPSSGTGTVGDWYFRTSNGYVYQKTGNTSWTFRRDITGPQGATGARGASGSDGDDAHIPQGIYDAMNINSSITYGSGATSSTYNAETFSLLSITNGETQADGTRVANFNVRYIRRRISGSSTSNPNWR